MTKRFFVTGTDTEVGKTVASSALLQAANQLGFNTAGYKPVASGSDLTAHGLRNEDALALQRHSRVALRYDQVNPYTFAEPTSPHIISADEGRPIAAGEGQLATVGGNHRVDRQGGSHRGVGVPDVAPIEGEIVQCHKRLVNHFENI